MNKEMRVAYIGAGNIAARHRWALEQIPGVKLVAYASHDGKHMPAVDPKGNKHDLDWGQGYTGVTVYNEMLREQKPDAVWLFIPPSAHGPIEADLIQTKIPFFVEKPLSLKLETAQTIFSHLEHANLPVAVGYQFRALEITQKAQEELKSVKVHEVTGRWVDQAMYYGPTWLGKQELSGGLVNDQLTHIIDWARYLVGDMHVEHVEASFDKPADLLQKRPDMADADIATKTGVSVVFDGGIKGTFLSSGLYTEGERQVNLEFVCEDDITILLERDRLIKTRKGVVQRHILSTTDFVFYPTEAEDRAFLEAVKKQDPSLVFCNYKEALKTHQLVMRINEMAQK